MSKILLGREYASSLHRAESLLSLICACLESGGSAASVTIIKHGSDDVFVGGRRREMEIEFVDGQIDGNSIIEADRDSAGFGRDFEVLFFRGNIQFLHFFIDGVADLLFATAVN